MTVHSALERCVDLVGRVDLRIVCSLAKVSEAEALASLSGAVYYDPEQEALVTAEEYLSGNILKKLNYIKALKAAGDERGFEENVKALETVLPPEIKPNQIKAALGSPWIPTWVYRDFITALMGIKSASGKHPLFVEYIREANHFIIHGKKPFLNFTRAKLTYGTERMNAFEIIERMLNSREIAVYDTVFPDGKDQAVRRINKQETLLAQERSKQIAERFSYWLFKDEPRRSELLALYNENFCAIRPRRFDGSRMLLPGKNPDIKLQKHQLDAIMRIIHSKNVLIAHQVGAGKTYVLAAAAMELRRLGISRRNLIVVPNNILEQWHYEFLQLYPDANILPLDYDPDVSTANIENRLQMLIMNTKMGMSHA